MTPTDSTELVPGRSCGDCNVCCVALTIDDPELRKLQGYRCPNTVGKSGCAIYEIRPHTCRTYFCAWRRLKWVREPLRPDLSGVLVALHGEVSKEDGSRRLGIMVTLLTATALKAEGLAETVAAAVVAGLPVFLQVPGPPGYTAGVTRLNDALLAPVAAKNKIGVLEVLRVARARGRAGGQNVPIVLPPREGKEK